MKRIDCIKKFAWIGSVAFLLGLSTFLATAIQLPKREALPNIDQRQREAAPAAAVPAERAAGAAAMQAQVPKSRVDFDPVTRAPKMVSATEGFLTGAGGQGRGVTAATAAAFRADDPHRATKAFLRQHRPLFGHGPEALDAARVTRDYVTPHNGMKTAVSEIVIARMVKPTSAEPSSAAVTGSFPISM